MAILKIASQEDFDILMKYFVSEDVIIAPKEFIEQLNAQEGIALRDGEEIDVNFECQPAFSFEVMQSFNDYATQQILDFKNGG